jgi:hypothetical protein
VAPGDWPETGIRFRAHVFFVAQWGAGGHVLEKSLNDVSKRHHIRLWKQEGEWKGQDVWIGAATHDVDFGYLRPGRPFAHKIAPDVDRERDKVAYDLAFTGCANTLDWAARTNVPRVTENGTGDAMTTDTRLAVVELNDCSAPRLSTETIDDAPVPDTAAKWSFLRGARSSAFATIFSATTGFGASSRL